MPTGYNTELVEVLPLVDVFTKRNVEFDYTLDDLKIAISSLGLDDQIGFNFAN